MAGIASSPDDPGPTGAADEPAARHLAHLVRVERIFVALRWSAILSWAPLLAWGGFDATAAQLWGLFALAVAYAVTAHLMVVWPGGDAGRHAARRSWITTLADPVLVTLACALTGGIESPLLVYLDLTVIAAAIRFGLKETLLVLALSAGLAILSHALASAPEVPDVELGLVLFNLAFSAAMGMLLSSEARDNLRLAIARAQDLAAARDQVRGLLWRLIGAEEDERKRLAGEVHDRLGGRLSLLQLDLERHRRDLPLAAGALLDAAIAQARACARDVRAVMNDLRPVVLDDFGFAEALGEWAAGLEAGGGPTVRLDVDPRARAAGSAVDAALFRILQEAVLNARKHAPGAPLRIAFRRHGGFVVLDVADDGPGFEPGRTPPGRLGLLTMRERAEALGGHLMVDSAPGQGTRVIASVPAAAP